MSINWLIMYFQSMIQNWLVTKVYKIKHDQCNFEFITKGMPSTGTNPNISFPNELSIYVSTLNKFITFIKNDIKLSNVIEKDNMSNNIIKRLKIMTVTRMRC